MDSHPGPWIQQALASIDVPVHLHLAGHDHNLQIGVPAPQSPYLQVVAGSGGGERAVRHPLVGGRFQLVQPGFARIDLVGDGEAARLVVSLIALPVVVALDVSTACRDALVGRPGRQRARGAGDDPVIYRRRA